MMDSTLLDNLKPRVRDRQGRCSSPASAKRYNPATGGAAIPDQWQRFTRRSARFPTRRKVAYGVCCNGDDSGNFDYIAGVEVATFPTCRANSPRADTRADDTRCSPTRAHLDHSPHRQHDLESLAAGVGLKAPTRRASSAMTRSSIRPPAMAGSKSGCR
jgi:hypothetical protein